MKKQVLDKFIKSPEWKIEDITKSSKAAGSLAVWAGSQLSYADILNKVGPMKK